MPGCSQCRMLFEGQCLAYPRALDIFNRPLPPPPLGACVLPIVEEYLSSISPRMRVLEIGCGSLAWIKSHCEKIGAHYEGIDCQHEYFGQTTVATRIENLVALSFPDEYFDIVLGNQTMEHWAEYGCPLRWGLYQCFRVCKYNGRVLMNVPIHFHGTRHFMLGQLEELHRLMSAFSRTVRFYKWGYPSDPLPPVYPFPGYRTLNGKPAFILDIHAIKDRPLPRVPKVNGGFSGRLAQVLNYPLSYNLYRVLRKLKML